MIFQKSGHPPILHAEDDENDILFLQRAFQKTQLENPLVAVHDGEEAIDYLNEALKSPDKKNPPLPCLILTDLKMPGMDGFELLHWLKSQPALQNIPAIVLSSSGEPEDRRRAAELGAADFWVKPSQMEMLISLVKEIRDTWIATHCSAG